MIFKYFHGSQLRGWCHELDEGRVPEGFQSFLEDVGVIKEEQ